MLELFAQINRNPPPPNAGAGAAGAGFGLAMIAFYFVLIVVILAVEIMFLISLSKCLKEIRPRNRTMEPGQVWLNLVPFLNYVWIFLTVIRVSESLEKEFRSRRLPQDGDYGKTMGLIGCVSAFVCCFVTPIFGIIYWVKIAGYTKLLRGAPSRGRDTDDYDDDRPSRRRDDDDDFDDRPPPPRKRRPRDEDEE